MADREMRDGETLAYDLRQTYAKIVGDHLIDVAESRKANLFYNWFKALEDVYTISKHNFENENEADKRYIALKKIITDLANKHKNVWLGLNKNDHQPFSEIESALRELEKFLYREMKDGGMFGSKTSDEGL